MIYLSVFMHLIAFAKVRLGHTMIKIVGNHVSRCKAEGVRSKPG